MGNNEESKSSKSDRSTSPTPSDQSGVHVYPPPDWAAVQAFYGARIPLPQYYNSAYPVGHPPHPYMWGSPQGMMSPFATPYAAIYSQGGVYAHQGVPAFVPLQGSPTLGLGALSTPSVADDLPATSLSIQIPGKTSGNTTGGSAGSESNDSGGSSNENWKKTTSVAEQSNGKRKRDIEKTEKLEIQANAVVSADANLVPGMVTGIAVGTSFNGKLENVTALDIVNTKMSLDAQLSGSKLSSDSCFQSERQLKQERRKQSNRESARRSRLRKQAETEELAAKVDVLMAENITLKSEINKLVKTSEKLKLENEKLKTTKLEKEERVRSSNGTIDDNGNQTLNTENLLSRVNNSGSVVTREEEEECEMYSNKNSNTTKLRQLLDASPRTDAVAAT